MDLPTIGGCRPAPLGKHLEHEVLGILAVLVVVGTTQQVVRIGHSCAKASCSDVASTAKR
jgi:hypothetical protein